MKVRIKKFKRKKKLNIPLMAVISLFLGVSFLPLFNVANLATSKFFIQPTQKATLVQSAYESELPNIPTKIVIEKANISLPVIPVKLDKGTWKVNDGVANYALETSRISSKGGNVGIYGHDLENAFARIKNINTGDRITITTTRQIAIYVVSSISVTDPSNVEVFYPTQNPTLTLVTCDGTFSQQRYIVKAKLISLVEKN